MIIIVSVRCLLFFLCVGWNQGWAQTYISIANKSLTWDSLRSAWDGFEMGSFLIHRIELNEIKLMISIKNLNPCYFMWNTVVFGAIDEASSWYRRSTVNNMINTNENAIQMDLLWRKVHWWIWFVGAVNRIRWLPRFPLAKRIHFAVCVVWMCVRLCECVCVWIIWPSLVMWQQ